MSYTTLDLLSTVKLRAMLPDASSGSLSPASLLTLATEELHNTLVPLILSVREKYYETYKDTAIVQNQDTYAIPGRAIGAVLSTVQLILNQSIAPLTQLDPAGISTTATAPTPSGFYFQNNSIVLWPTPNQAQGTLRMRYFQRPSVLEQTVNCAQVTSFDTIALTVTCASVPSTWTTGTVLDFVPKSLPSTPYGLGTVATGVAGSVVSFAALPAALAVGDWLSITETTPVPELPYEFFSVLAQATACKALEAIGDLQNLQLAGQKLEEYKGAALRMIAPREQSGTKKVVSGWRSW